MAMDFAQMFKWIITIYFLLDILFPMNNNRVNQNSEECSITYSGGRDVPAEAGVRVRSSWSRDPTRPPDWRIRRVTWPRAASWLEAAPVRIYTVYRDNIRSGGEHRSRASAATRHFFNYDIDLHNIRRRRNTIVTFPFSLLKTHLRPWKDPKMNLNIVTSSHIGTEVSPFKLV